MGDGRVYLLVLLSIVNAFVSFGIIAPIKPKWWIMVVGVLVCWLGSIMLLGVSEYIVTIMIVLTVSPVMYTKCRNVFMCITVTIIAVLITLISDYMFSNIIVHILKRDIGDLLYGTDSLRNAQIYAVGLVAFVAVFSCFVNYIINKKIKVSDIMFKGKRGFAMALLMIISLVVFYLATTMCKKMGFNNSFIQFTGFILVSYFLVLINVMFYMLENMASELELENQKSQNQTLHMYIDELENIHKNLRSFKHDYKNILSSIYVFILDRNVDGLKKYFEENILELEQKTDNTDVRLGFLQNLCLDELKGVLVIKSMKAKEAGVDLKIEVHDVIEKVNMDVIELIRILGILLDNAIEASSSTERPYILCSFSIEEEALVISVVNNFVGEIKDTDLLCESGYTTKPGNTGLGLNNMKKILEKYEEAKYSIMVDNDEFGIEIEIK